MNGLDSLALTKLDVLDELPEILLCTGYRYAGELITEFPSDLSVLEGCEPVYERFTGWEVSTAGTRDFAALPEPARRYVERIAELVGTEVGIVSTARTPSSGRGARSRPGSNRRGPRFPEARPHSTRNAVRMPRA